MFKKFKKRKEKFKKRNVITDLQVAGICEYEVIKDIN